MENSETDAHSTHPSLKDRIAALKSLPYGARKEDNAPALSLLENPALLEKQMFATLLSDESFKEIAWEEVGEKVYIPIWRELIKKYAGALLGITPTGLPDIARDSAHLRKKVAEIADDGRSSEEADHLMQMVIGAALAVNLYDREWKLSLPPGADVSPTSGEHTIEPFRIVRKLASGDITSDAWQKECANIGIAEVKLAEG